MLNATAARAAVDDLLQFARAADAADELDALVGALVADAEQRREHEILQARDVERRDRTRVADALVLPASSRSVYHAPSRYIAHSPLRAGVGRAGLDRELRAQRGEQRRGRVAREILHHAVIRQDLRLLLGERDAEEPRVLAVRR